MHRFTLEQAREYLLQYQHLRPPRALESDGEILGLIRKLGCIQFDPLRKTARNADLVLQSRCRNYKESRLENLLYKERRLLDYWDKNMAIWAIEDWPYFKRKREGFQQFYRNRQEVFRNIRTQIFNIIAKAGFVSSSDLQDKVKVDWAWAPTKIGRAALESMYHSGELVIHHKDGTRKYYALSTKLIPQQYMNRDDPFPDEKDYLHWYILRRIRSVGLLWNRNSEAWIGPDLKKYRRQEILDKLTDSGDLERINIEDFQDFFYAPSDSFFIPQHIDKSKKAAIIAPLDNLIWDRGLTEKIFHFRYRWEVYTPVKKREYGYYVLPIIYGNRFIARCEPSFDRKTGILTLENFWWEKNIDVDAEIKQEMKAAFHEFALFLGAEEIRISSVLKKSRFQWITETK